MNDTKAIIDEIDCYGDIAIGKTIEVITFYGSYLIDNSDFTNWDSFVNWLLNVRHYTGVQELLAEN